MRSWACGKKYTEVWKKRFILRTGNVSLNTGQPLPTFKTGINTCFRCDLVFAHPW